MKSTIARATLVAPGLLLMLAGCGNSSEVSEVREQQITGVPTAVAPAPIVLDPLDAESLDVASLDGELGCSFGRERGGDPLLVAYAFVAEEGGDAAIRVNGRIVPLSMTGVGGFSRMTDGATFVGEGLMATVTVTGTDPLRAEAEVAQESPVFAANLAVSRLEEEIVIEGFYQCGP